MPKFIYRVCTDEGKIIRGSLESESLERALSILRRQGYTPLKIREEAHWQKLWLSTLRGFLGRVRAEELILFTRQLRSLILAGVSILKTLDIVVEQVRSPVLKDALLRIRREVEGGLDLSSAMMHFPRIFSELYINILKAGEKGGVLPEVLDRLSIFLEYEEKTRREIKSSLRYPVIVFCAMVSASFIFTIFVIPKFAAIFSKFHLDLPLPTQWVFNTSTFLRNHIGILALAIVLLLMVIRLYMKTEKGREKWDEFKLRLPIFGSLFQKVVLFRFAWMLKLMYQSGLPIVKALKIMETTLFNHTFEKEIHLASERVEAGESLSSYLEKSPWFPPMVVHLIATGESSGTLDQMLEEITRHYDAELAYRIRNLTTLIEPMVTLFLACGVFILALAIFLPMIDLVKIAKQ
ncbi:MAG: type II secretion system F family protein [Chlamydiae bacterium]|nr:type II secretion system F family protein [Chlamydiota bacterium]MBI3276700.1 type II secretion system F family protein [Chlamydiota bacterium]